MFLNYDNWFEIVEGCVINQYKQLKMKGDIDNSVLSAFLLYNKNNSELEVLSLATGTKLMSGDIRKLSEEDGPIYMHDCHAEILAHRGFQVWIYDQLNNSKQNEFFDNKRNLKENYTIHFYSSTTPCGDCCVIQDKNDYNVQTGSKPFGWDINQLQSSPPNILRGKPGRGSRSQSMSCSDKITLWIHLGVEGSLLSNIIQKLSITTLNIGNSDLKTCERAFFKRLNVEKYDEKIIVHKSSWKQKDSSPSSTSMLWINGRSYELIQAKNGRKLGIIEKNRLIPKLFPIASDALMLKRYCLYRGIKEITLSEAKSHSKAYIRKKELIKNQLLNYGGSWCEKFEKERNWLYNEEKMKF